MEFHKHTSAEMCHWNSIWNIEIGIPLEYLYGTVPRYFRGSGISWAAEGVHVYTHVQKRTALKQNNSKLPVVEVIAECTANGTALASYNMTCDAMNIDVYKERER